MATHRLAGRRRRVPTRRAGARLDMTDRSRWTAGLLRRGRFEEVARGAAVPWGVPPWRRNEAGQVWQTAVPASRGSQWRSCRRNSTRSMSRDPVRAPSRCRGLDDARHAPSRRPDRDDSAFVHASSSAGAVSLHPAGRRTSSPLPRRRAAGSQAATGKSTSDAARKSLMRMASVVRTGQGRDDRARLRASRRFALVHEMRQHAL